MPGAPLPELPEAGASLAAAAAAASSASAAAGSGKVLDAATFGAPVALAGIAGALVHRMLSAFDKRARRASRATAAIPPDNTGESGDE